MFDPVTEELIRTAPTLPDFDLENLPQKLTDAHVKIASLRIQLLAEDAEHRGELFEELGTLQRLANYYQSFVATLSNHPQEAPAAFVAASAHELLHRARINLGTSESRPSLTDDAVESDLASVLLYLIAGYPSSAHEMAAAVDTSLLEEPRRSLVTAILAIARGLLLELADVPAQVDWHSEVDFDQFAVDLLWQRLEEGCLSLASGLRGSSGAFEDSRRAFHEVLKLSSFTIQELLHEADSDNSGGAVSCFAGPHQLASLLRDLGDELERRAVVTIDVPPGLSSGGWHDALKSLAERRPYLWRNHRQAIDDGFLSPGNSSVIAFPTGAGKTTLAELKCISTRLCGRKVLYLAPTHALVNQVTKDLKSSFPAENIGNSLIAEGHYSETEEASLPDISIMTPERCLALQGFAAAAFEEVGLVVFDECHLLHPKEKGNDRRSLDAMLCLLGLMTYSPGADFVLLSAMISNGPDLAAWIASETGRSCLPMELDWKPTRQARGCVVYKKEDSSRLRTQIRTSLQSTTTKGPPTALRNNLRINPFAFFSLRQAWTTQESRDYSLLPISTHPVSLSAAGNRPWWRLNPNKNHVSAEIAAEFARTGMKVLVFVQTRRDTNAVAEQVAAILSAHVTPEPASEEEKRLFELASSEVGGDQSVYAPCSGLAAAHHSLLLPCEREMNELAFRTDGRVACLACTATLAQGMNFPADLVILAGENRFNQSSGAREQLGAHDLLNAAGRAGRAGSRSSGLVLMIPDSIIEIDLEKMSLGLGWFELQQSIFGLTDRCLAVEDPLEGLLDIIETAQGNLPVDALYLFDRLPIGASEHDDKIAREMMHRSFSAYHARQRGEEAEFGAKVTRALAAGRSIRNHSTEEDWEIKLALAAGVDVRIVSELGSSLAVLIDNPPITVVDWLDWWFLWVKEKDDRKALLTRTTTGHRATVVEGLGLGGEDLFGSKLFLALELWMKGAPLRELENTIFGIPINKVGKCDKSRQFRNNVVPEIAYAAGLITQVYRQILENAGKTGEMPVSLACLSSCIREGFMEPEQLVVGYLWESRLSRPQAHEKWEEIKVYAAPRDNFERYHSTVSRVDAALLISSFAG